MIAPHVLSMSHPDSPGPHPTSPRPCHPPALPIKQNDIKLVYKKIEEGADVNFVFGRAYKCPEGYTPLMVACHRGRSALLEQGSRGGGILGEGIVYRAVLSTWCDACLPGLPYCAWCVQRPRWAVRGPSPACQLPPPTTTQAGVCQGAAAGGR